VIRLADRSPSSAEESSQEGDDQEGKENEEQDLRDASRGSGYTAEAERAGNNGNDQKNESPVKHDVLLMKDLIKKT
jgi:hypothetical protein